MARDAAAVLEEVRRVVSWFEANVSPWHSARFGAVRLLANEVPGPGLPTAVEPVPALRSERDRSIGWASRTRDGCPASLPTVRPGRPA